jgi:hypothetical protein
MRYLPGILVVQYVATLALGLLLRDLLAGPVDPEVLFGSRRLLSLLVAMPVLETVAIHMLVIEACATAGRGRSGALYVGAVLAAIVFFLLHVLAKSIFNGLVYGLTGGVAFSVMYVMARRDGRKAAFVATWLLHLSSNALLVLSIAYYGMLLGVT